MVNRGKFGTLTLTLEADRSGLDRDMQTARAETERVAGQIGRRVRQAMTLALAGVGALVAQQAREISQGFEVIAAGTGRTGAELTALQDDLKTLFREVPNTGEEIGQAIAELNTRLGLVGEELQDATRAALGLGRAFDADVTEVAKTAAVAVEQFNLSGGQAAKVLDIMAITSQGLGINIGELSTGLQRTGAQFAQLGFTVEETTAFLGQLEQSGIKARQVSSGLSQALTNLAKTGGDLRTGFTLFIDEIQNTTSASRALQLSIELFGSEVGPRMVGAIRNMSFDIEGLLRDFENWEGRSDAIGRSSESLGDKLRVASRIILGDFAEGGAAGIQILRDMIDGFRDLDPAIQSSVSSWGLIGAAAITTFVALGPMGPLVAALGAAVVGLAAIMVTYWPQISKTVEEEVGVIRDSWDRLEGDVDGTWIETTVLPAVRTGAEAVVGIYQWMNDRIGDLFTGDINVDIADYFQSIISGAYNAGRATGEWVKEIIERMRDLDDTISGFRFDWSGIARNLALMPIVGAFTPLPGLVRAALAGLASLIGGFRFDWSGMVRSLAQNPIVLAFVPLPVLIAGILGSIAGFIQDWRIDWSGMVRSLAGIPIISAFTPIPGIVAGVLGSIAGLILGFRVDWSGIAASLWNNPVIPFFMRLPSYAGDAVSGISNALSSLGSTLAGFVSTLGSMLMALGSTVASGISSFLSTTHGAVMGFVGSLTATITGYIRTVGDVIGGLISGAGDRIRGFIASGTDAVQSTISTLGGVVVQFGSVFGGIVDAVAGAWRRLIGIITGGGLASAFHAAVISPIQHGIQTIKDLIDGLVDTVQSVVDRIRNIRVPEFKIPSIRIPGIGGIGGTSGNAGAIQAPLQILPTVPPPHDPSILAQGIGSSSGTFGPGNLQATRPAVVNNFYGDMYGDDLDQRVQAATKAGERRGSQNQLPSGALPFGVGVA